MHRKWTPGCFTLEEEKLGLSDKGENHHLWQYLGDTWLHIVNEENMLDLLCHQITSDSATMARDLHVEDVNLTDKLFKRPGLNDAVYKSAQGWRWLHELGHDIFE